MKGLKVLKLNFSVYGQYALGFDKIFDYTERITTISSLLFTSEQFIMVSKVEWMDEPDIESMRQSIIIDDIIEISSEEKTSMYIVVGHLPPIVSELMSHVIKEYKCFFEFPIVNVKGKMTIPVVGSKESLKELLAHLDELNVEYEIMTIMSRERTFCHPSPPLNTNVWSLQWRTAFSKYRKRQMHGPWPQKEEHRIPHFSPISGRPRRRYLRSFLGDF
jgi:hypothetical protein